MAKQSEIQYEATEWADDSVGGTPITAAQLNRMEGGIADACAAADGLRTKRLPTYVVLEGGDTATQDAYAEPILGPCLILDLATRTTYYESGGDEEGHRKAITSGADIDAIRDSLSQADFSTVRTFSAKYFKNACVELWWYTEDDGNYVLTLPTTKGAANPVQLLRIFGDSREVLKEW